MNISVLYEDAACVVIDKPAGMPSHPLSELDNKSALEVISKNYPEVAKASDNPKEGGLVHRLDTGTSGILIFARHNKSYLELRKAFSENLIEKTYVALVEGKILKPLYIDYPVAHHPKNKAKMIAVTPKNKYFRGKAREARTWVYPENSRVSIKIKGGCRHQIRVHLASVGHPLVGDILYGAKEVPGLNRHMLHANWLKLPNGKEVFSDFPDALPG